MVYGEFAKIYDKLIYEDIDYDLIGNRLKKIIEENNTNKEDYLDLACGTGNVTVKMADDFKNIYAVDLSDDMLMQAYEKFQERNIDARVICQNMSELDLNHKFDLISCMLDSTNYILDEEDLRDYFKGVFAHLKDEGVFVFDINSYYKLSEILGDNIYIHDEDNVFYSWENVFEDEIVSMYLTFFVKDKKQYERFEEEHHERAYREAMIEEMLAEEGFKVIKKYDGYTEDEVNEKSERILYVVKKDVEE